jgi:hypothetical protein
VRDGEIYVVVDALAAKEDEGELEDQSEEEYVYRQTHKAGRVRGIVIFHGCRFLKLPHIVDCGEGLRKRGGRTLVVAYL